MDYLIYIIAGILSITGLLGCIIPGLPGPPFNFVALLLIHFTSSKPFTPQFLWVWAIVTVVVTIADYLIPVMGTKKYGASKWGIIGSFLGILAGFFIFPPFGIIIGPFIGAVAGELIAGKTSIAAIRAGAGSFFGFVLGTLLKLIVSGIMTFHFFRTML